MNIYFWFILIGCLMLARGLSATTLSRLPVTSAIVYLGVGLALGPAALGVFGVNPIEEARLLELMSELAVLISLFSAGVKMPVPFSLARWAPSIRLAWLSMTISVALVAGFGWLVLGLPVGAAILLGAILAPTDPVLATDVQVRHPGDKDELRFSLTSEAGMNDGSAFPLVMLGLGLLGLHELGSFGWQWALVDVLWATSSAVLIGVAGGAALAQLGWALRNRDPRHEVLDDLVGLGLIAVVYGVAASVHSWGFLAVFFAGVALRQRELKLSGAPKDRHGLREPLPAGDGQGHADAPLTVSGETLIFKEHLERLSELTLVLLLGASVTAHTWDWRAWSTALFLFLVARPASVLLGLAGSSTTGRVRGFTAWFGVRGIGSVYYLMYAINHGLPPALARDLVDITLVVIMLSIVAHGISTKPLFDRFWPEER